MTDANHTRSLTVWQDGSTVTEDRQAPGWVVLVELEPCPQGCVGGEVWGGDDLATCPVCDGASVVPVGRGGAYIQYSERHPVPEEPELSFYSHALRHRVEP